MTERFDRMLPVDDPRCDSAIQVIRKLQQAGFTAFWAGGCVRDLLRGATPRDYDVATNAVPDVVTRLFPDSSAVGRAFGVILVRSGDFDVEVATFRDDHGYSDGRHPDRVTFSTPERDAERRDFTINAMFLDPVSGILHDFVGGRADLCARIVRCVGDPVGRLTEDHLRMLRAIRFASTLDFALDPATADAIRACAPRASAISPERVRDELVRLLTEAVHPGDAVRSLDAHGLLGVLLPEVAAMKGQAQPEAFHPEGDVFTHTILMLNSLPREPEAALALAVLFHDIGKPPTASFDGERLRFNNHDEVGARLTEAIMRRLRFSSHDTERVRHCVGNHMRVAMARKMRRATLRRMIGAPAFALELELHRMDCESSHRDMDNHRFLAEAVRQLGSEPVLPSRWVTGADLLALGLPPGPRIGRLLQETYDAQLEGRFASREAALAWLREERVRPGS
jgi:poly(A) polymerase